MHSQFLIRVSHFTIGVGLLFLFFISEPTQALATMPTGFAETLVTAALNNATAMEIAPDGRIFVAQQGGSLRVIKNGQLLTQPFLTVPVDSNGERGLLGVTFDPNFTSNQHVYIYYTTTSPTRNRLSRVTANGDTTQTGSEVVLMEFENLSASNHNGGAIHFGADGKLYVAIGDNAVSSNSQTTTNRLGKMLRLNADGSIPADNPFYTSATGNNRAIWTLGLRNPFTFAVQPETGKIFINDVGESTWEEINEGQAGANYGWPSTEGTTNNSSFKSPFYAYNHSGGGCAISGGAFYNPNSVTFPSEYTGDYFFGDYCGGWIKRLDLPTKQVDTFASDLGGLVDLKTAADGSLYYLTRNSIRRIQYTTITNAAPAITSQPQSQTVSVGNVATFSVTATGNNITYQWKRNGVLIDGATNASYALSPSITDSGAQFQVILSNSSGSVASSIAQLIVTSAAPPIPTITQPVVNQAYEGGQVIYYAGSAVTGSGATLPANALSWKIDFHHETHVHPFMDWITGSASGSFTIPRVGEVSDNVWYRVYLKAADGSQIAEVYRDIQPKKVSITLASNPPGLTVLLDGQPKITPHTFTGVVGITRRITMESPQYANNSTYYFSHWSDGGIDDHTVQTPSVNTTYTATGVVFASAPYRDGYVDFSSANQVRGWAYNNNAPTKITATYEDITNPSRTFTQTVDQTTTRTDAASWLKQYYGSALPVSQPLGFLLDPSVVITTAGTYRVKNVTMVSSGTAVEISPAAMATLTISGISSTPPPPTPQPNQTPAIRDGYGDTLTPTKFDGWFYDSTGNDTTAVITYRAVDSDQLYSQVAARTITRPDADTYLHSNYGTDITIIQPLGFSVNPASVLKVPGTYRVQSVRLASSQTSISLSPQATTSFVVPGTITPPAPAPSPDTVVSAPLPATNVHNYRPFGYLDSIGTDGVVRGWAADANDISKSVLIHFYLDRGPNRKGSNAVVVTANIFRKDVGLHGFEFALPAQYRDGNAHILHAFAVDPSNGTRWQRLLGVPVVFRVQSSGSQFISLPQANDRDYLPFGYVDNVTRNGSITGWAMDANEFDKDVHVHFYIDTAPHRGGRTAFSTTANAYREDIGNHSFSATIPHQYRDGKAHRIYAYAVDPADGTRWRLLLHSPLLFTLSP